MFLDLLVILSLVVLPLQSMAGEAAKPCAEKHVAMDAGSGKIMAKDCKCGGAGPCSWSCSAACSISCSIPVPMSGSDFTVPQAEAVPPLAEACFRGLMVAPELRPPRIFLS